MGRSIRRMGRVVAGLAVLGLLLAECSGGERTRLVDLMGPTFTATSNRWDGTVHYGGMVVGYEGEGPIQILDVVPRFATVEVPVGAPFAFTSDRPIFSTDMWTTLEELEKSFPGWRASFRSLDELEHRPPSPPDRPQGVAIGVQLDLSGLSEDLFIPAVEVHYHDGRRRQVLVLHNGLMLCPPETWERRCGQEQAKTFYEDLPPGV